MKEKRCKGVNKTFTPFLFDFVLIIAYGERLLCKDWKFFGNRI